jgi:TonB family protein
MPTSDTKAEISAEAPPAGSPPIPEPEYHLTFVDSTLPPVSLFRQILERLREPKIKVAKKYYQQKVTVDATPAGSSAVPGAEFHPTFVDSTLPPVSLFRQILERLREPKVTVPKEYYRGKATPPAAPPGGSPVPGAEFRPTFVESTLPPVSLFRQALQGLREPKFKVPEKYLPGKTSLPAAELPPPVWEDPNQLALPFEKLKGPVPISSWRTSVPEAEYHLVMIADPEAIKWRRRTMYLSSLILHGLLVLVLVFSPDLLRRGKQMMGFPVEVAPRKQYSFLLLPPELLRRLREPPPENSPLSDRDRRAQGRSPTINPNGLRMPYSLGNTKLPELAGGGKPPAAAPTPPPAGGNTAPGGPPASQPSNQTPLEAKNEGGLRLEDVKPNTGGGGSGLNLPSLTPGQAIQQSLHSAARAGRYPSGSGSGSGGYGDGNAEFQNLEPNFSTEGPIILSDTRGVDFGPYLARVVFIVKRNWYSVIPESARLGEKGRVAIVFEILKDGAVPQLRLVASSGADALDRAALAGIRASIPFPPLPDEFTGNHLVLQFIFLYNMTLGQ